MEEKKRLKIGIITNCVLHKTGLARNARAIVPLLFKSGKYDIHFLNQQLPDNAPEFQRLPWKNFGVNRNVDQQRVNQDGNYNRAVAYGGPAAEEFILSNKLDCVIGWDDAWAYLPEYFYEKDWFSHIKNNFALDITADSEPILPLIKDWAKKCPNIWFWSSFAERVLKKEDPIIYANVKTLRGAVEGTEFKPLPKNERLELRHKFGIKDDEKIMMFLGRCQLRKLFGPTMEGLAKFKKRHPNKKTRLLFHTGWWEQNGWPLNQIREQLGLAKEDVLTTYFCKACGDWHIQPFEGEDLNCNCCNQKQKITAGVISSISETDLNKIYNLADGATSIFTSGGQENFSVESMLAGVPLCCPNYSCGEDFILSKLVYQIKGTYTYEHNTGFKKFVPDINSICDFYEYVWDLPENKRLDLTTKAREWALNEFSPIKITNQLMEWIDSRQPIDWDIYFNKKKELRNTNAQIEDKPNDEEFILECYTKILGNPEVKNNDPNGYNYWKNFLSQPRDKNQLKNEMVGVFRNAAQDHNKKVQPNNTLEDLLIKNGKKHFLIVCPQSAGDILYVSATLKSFRESYNKEEWNIYFACQSEFQELLELNPNIDKILKYEPFMDNEIAMLGQVNKGPFQGYCFVPAFSQRFLNYLGNHNINLNLQ